MKYLKKPKYSSEQVTDEVRQTVSTILSDVERNGEAAVRKYSERFDSWSPESFRVSQEEIDRAYEEMEPEVEESSQFLIDQVGKFAQLQRDTLVGFEVETLPGILLGQKHIPVQNVGAYSPGGLYPLIASAASRLSPQWPSGSKTLSRST